MNFFAYYGLPVALEIDKSVLRKAFYAKSREVHPDQHATDSEQLAAINNEAFRVLSDEDARIRHLLELHGYVSLEHEKLPPEFLMQMMDINEAIMEAESQEDAQRVMQEVADFERAMYATIEPLRYNWPSDSAGKEAAMRVLKDYAIKKRYLLRVRENLSKFAPS